MEPIYLYPDIKEGYHVVTFGDSNELLSTPNGTVIQSKNAQLIENLVFDLQKYSEVSPQEIIQLPVHLWKTFHFTLSLRKLTFGVTKIKRLNLMK